MAIDGRLSGVRIRRNFKTPEEASTETAVLEIEAVQIESGRPNEAADALFVQAGLFVVCRSGMAKKASKTDCPI